MHRRREARANSSGAIIAPEGDPSSFERRWSGTVEAPGADRADVYIAEVAQVLNRSQIKARDAVLRVNGAVAKLSRPLKPGDFVELMWTEEPASTLVPEDIPLTILYEDDRCLVVDKAQGMVVHPGAGNRRGTLANALLGLAGRRRSEADAPQRGGIVHRLDKDTSGLIIAAKDLGAQAFLAGQFKDRVVRKDYLAVTSGVPLPRAGRISDRLGRDRRDRKRFTRVESGGKIAVTDYRVLASWGGIGGGRGESYALVALRPKTGRTHQLRVHMAGMGTPILGDPLYGKRDPRFPEANLMLHARRLRLVLPGHAESSVFIAPIPARFRAIIRALSASFGPGRRFSETK